jgi:hypothetical protein
LADFYIAADWLEATRGSAFFYPAAGSDHTEALNIFQDYVDVFWFCDTMYQEGLNLPAVCASNTGWRLVGRNISGVPMATPERRIGENGREYYFLQPSKLAETYERKDGRRLTVIRRRGFGQIALSKELGDRSLGVFMHRGDSRGEGGSNVYFLSNKKTEYEPCGNLFDKLGRRLKDKALIISDGSNASIRRRRLRRFHHKPTEGREAFSYHQGRTFQFGGFDWTCVGWLSRRNGPTLVWGLTRQD